MKNIEDTGIYEEKKKADDKLNRERIYFREKLKKRMRKRYFRNSDIIIFNQQFEDRFSEFQKLILYLFSPVYQIREHAALISLIYKFKMELIVDKKYIRRLKCIRF
jgi:hypothetical protein